MAREDCEHGWLANNCPYCAAGGGAARAAKWWCEHGRVQGNCEKCGLNEASDLAPHGAAPEHRGREPSDEVVADGGGLEGVGPV
jgi:hypothetical protein